MKQKLFAGVSLLLAIAFLYTGQRFVLKDALRLKAVSPVKATSAATTVPTANEVTDPPSTTPTTTASASTAPPASSAATQTDPSTAATTATQPVTSTSASAPSSAATTAAPTQTQKQTTAPGTQTQPTEPTTPAHSTQPTDPTDPSTRIPPVVPPEDRVFRQAPPDYFKDALFIGDSRTEELMEYGDLPGATFFARVSMSIYNMHKKTCKVNNGIGDISFDDLMANYQFKKVYIMLGVNEIDYDRATTVNKYHALIDELRAKQPDAIIFIQANIHLTQKESDKSSTINNKAIDDLNEKISRFADQKTVFYIDPNERFDDGHGALRAECSGDGTHLKARYTREWAEWLKTKAIL